MQPSKPAFVKSSLNSSPQPLPIFPVGKISSPSCPEAQCRWVSSSACFSLKTGSSLITKAAGPHLGSSPCQSGSTLRIFNGQAPSPWSSSLRARHPPHPYPRHRVCPAPKFLLPEPKSGLLDLEEPGLSPPGMPPPPPQRPPPSPSIPSTGSICIMCPTGSGLLPVSPGHLTSPVSPPLHPHKAHVTGHGGAGLGKRKRPGQGLQGQASWYRARPILVTRAGTPPWPCLQPRGAGGEGSWPEPTAAVIISPHLCGRPTELWGVHTQGSP